MSESLHQNSGDISGDSGSPEPGEPLFLTVGKLLRSHGVNGFILISVITHFPERLVPGKVIYAGKNYQPLTIEKVQGHRDRLMIKFQGIEDKESVAAYTNQMVYVNSRELPMLPEGEYYHHQLLGLQVFNKEGQQLGTLEEILETGANDVYLVKTFSGEEILLPAIDGVVVEIDLVNHTMLVEPPVWYNE